jgi:uncharacterized protein (DUF952 family)
MAELYHLADRGDWRSAAQTGEYRGSTRGVTLQQEGFMCCSLRHQLRGVAELLYADADADDLVVLVIDSELVPAPIRYEAPEPGAEIYRHIYGHVPIGAVTRVVPVSRDLDGAFQLPD